MGKGDDDTIYCNVQMPLLPGRELLNLVNALRESGAHPNLDLVFQHMQLELKMSIDIVENPPTWGAGEPTRH
jgi:pullulanase/glycogen debranching enzyme